MGLSNALFKYFIVKKKSTREPLFLFFCYAHNAQYYNVVLCVMLHVCGFFVFNLCGMMIGNIVLVFFMDQL